MQTIRSYKLTNTKIQSIKEKESLTLIHCIYILCVFFLLSLPSPSPFTLLLPDIHPSSSPFMSCHFLLSSHLHITIAIADSLAPKSSLLNIINHYYLFLFKCPIRSRGLQCAIYIYKVHATKLCISYTSEMRL